MPTTEVWTTQTLWLMERMAKGASDRMGRMVGDSVRMALDSADPAVVAKRSLAGFVRLSDVRDGTPHAGDGRMVLAVKCAMAVLACHTGEWSHVAPQERARLWAAAHDLGEGFPIGHAPSVPANATAVGRPDGGVIVAFRFPWAPGSARKGIATSTGHVGVTALSAAEAPVACLLPVTPAPGMRTAPAPLRVLRFGGDFLRPVLAPGSWDPVDIDAFAAAAASGHAWVDDPFAPPHRPGIGVVGCADYGGAVKVSPGDAAREAGALAAAMERAGRLFVIDGVVHRTCPAPEAVHVPALDRVTWAIGALHGSATMDTIHGKRRGPASPGPWWNVYDEGVALSSLRVPLAEHAMLDRLQRVPPDGRADPVPCCTVVEPELLPRDPVALLRVAIRLDESRSSFGMMAAIDASVIDAASAMVASVDDGGFDDAAMAVLQRFAARAVVEEARSFLEKALCAAVANLVDMRPEGDLDLAAFTP